MRVRGRNNVGRTVQTDPTLLRYASTITELKKCREMLSQKFDRSQTLHKNSQQHATTRNRVCKRTQHVTSNNVAGGGGGGVLASNAASVRTRLYNKRGLSDVWLVLWSRAIGFERRDY